MKIFTENVQSLEALYVMSLRKALDMEQKIETSLPDLIDRSADDELTAAFTTHLDETRAHIAKVNVLLGLHTLERNPLTSKPTASLVAAISSFLDGADHNVIRDIGLIGLAQQVEHQEIAVYGTMRRWAELLGFEQDVQILESIQADEVNADAVLSDISERVNVQAAVV